MFAQVRRCSRSSRRRHINDCLLRSGLPNCLLGSAAAAVNRPSPRILTRKELIAMPPSSTRSHAQLRRFYVTEVQHDTILVTPRSEPNSTCSASNTSKCSNNNTRCNEDRTTRASSCPDSSSGINSASTTDSFKAKKFERVINADVIDIVELRECAWNFIPEQHRSQTWQHLLGYLPLNAARRAAALKRKRDQYKSFADAHFTSIDDATRTIEERKLIRQIQVDCPRTEPNLPFFKDERVQRCIERLLVTWSSRNLATGYVQGMNDLIAIIFLVFLKPHASDCDNILSDDTLATVEADTYWCFARFISNIQDHYTHDQPGIQRMLGVMEILLEKVDPELWQHFQREGVHICYFGWKWMNNFLSRELPFNCIIRYWDSMLSEEDGFEDLHVYTCVALLHKLRADLMEMKHDELFQYLTQGELKMSRIDIEEILGQAYVWKTTVDKKPTPVKEEALQGRLFSRRIRRR